MALTTLCTFVFGTEYSVGDSRAASTESEFSISNVGFDGSDNGISVFNVSSLTQIRYEGNAEERISFLHKLARIVPAWQIKSKIIWRETNFK